MALLYLDRIRPSLSFIIWFQPFGYKNGLYANVSSNSQAFFLQSQVRHGRNETETVAETAKTHADVQAKTQPARASQTRKTSKKTSACNQIQADRGQLQGGRETSSSSHEWKTDEAEDCRRTAIAFVYGGTKETLAGLCKRPPPSPDAGCAVDELDQHFDT